MGVAILQGRLEGLANSQFLRGGFVVGGGTLLGVDFGFRERGPGSSYVSDWLLLHRRSLRHIVPHVVSLDMSPAKLWSTPRQRSQTLSQPYSPRSFPPLALLSHSTLPVGISSRRHVEGAGRVGGWAGRWVGGLVMGVRNCHLLCQYQVCIVVW